jgi:hypothetical protein
MHSTHPTLDSRASRRSPILPTRDDRPPQRTHRRDERASGASRGSRLHFAPRCRVSVMYQS